MNIEKTNKLWESIVFNYQTTCTSLNGLNFSNYKSTKSFLKKALKQKNKNKKNMKVNIMSYNCHKNK